MDSESTWKLVILSSCMVRMFHLNGVVSLSSFAMYNLILLSTVKTPPKYLFETLSWKMISLIKKNSLEYNYSVKKMFHQLHDWRWIQLFWFTGLDRNEYHLAYQYIYQAWCNIYAIIIVNLYKYLYFIEPQFLDSCMCYVILKNILLSFACVILFVEFM